LIELKLVESYTMTEVKTGRIYKITHKESNLCYVGSTFDPLSIRWKNHTSNFKVWLKKREKGLTIFRCFEKFGVKQFQIVLIKEYQVCDKQHLLAYEQLWINTLKPINEKNPLWILKKVQKRQYYVDNRDYFAQKNKEWAKNNPEKTDAYKKKWANENKDKVKQYRLDNRERLCQKKKEYREKNLETLKQKSVSRVNCECGAELSYSNYAAHRRTKRHYLNLLPLCASIFL
jgi:hypothetical protein